MNFELALGSAPLAAPATDTGAAAATRINDFSFDLLRKLDPTGNLCLSPTSIALTLAMVRAGARGTTATEMDQVLRSLGAPGQAPEIVALLQQLSLQITYADADGFPLPPEATPDPAYPDPMVELRMANQAFAQKGMSLEQDYLDALSSSFGAGVGQLDFIEDPEAARLTVNKWGSDNTNGRIPAILRPGDVDNTIRIAIANAAYLKAGWQMPFDTSQTKPRPFTTASGVSISVPTMASSTPLRYGTGSGYRAVELPFTDGSLSMLIVVPNSMAAFTAGLTAAKLAAISEGTEWYFVDLTMPRFSIDTRYELIPQLQSVGMHDLFDPLKADLTGITRDEIAQSLYIKHVIHQANIEVVEEGVTASAVTVAMGGTTGAQPPATFKVDRPFLYFIHERESGVVLFMGRVDDPSVAAAS